MSDRPGYHQRLRIPPLGGTVTVSLVETRAAVRAGGGPKRSPRERVLARLQLEEKLNGLRPSDEVETFRIEVKWEPTKGALGVLLPPHLQTLEPGELEVASSLYSSSFYAARIYHPSGSTKPELRGITS